MQFVFLIVDRKGAPAGEPAGLEEMEKYAGELASEGKILGGAPLHPEALGARVQVRGHEAIVTDGPFAESKEVIGGFVLIEAASRAEAIELAKRCPHVRSGIVEVRPVREREVAKTARGPQFMFLLRWEAGASDADGSKLREIVAYDEVLKKAGRYVEGTCLRKLGAEGFEADPVSARVELRGGRMLVTDGPFAETKEAVAGYCVVEAANRAEAIAIAKPFPHARWGSVEVREVWRTRPS